MTESLFPDNTVLCNFAAVNRLDLLRSVLNGRGRWTEAVAFEARRSSKALPPLASLLDDACMGEPIEINDEAETLHVEQIRRAVFGGTETDPLRHLGEAQTCYVIMHWKEFGGSWWISDDREALRYARFQGITTRETFDLVSTAVVNGDIRADDGLALMKEMAACGRSLRLPASAGDFYS
jgi:hypothetical protein